MARQSHPRYSEAELEAAVDRLTDPARFREAEAAVAAAAPRLQHVLAQALGEGGWFAESHEDEVRKAVAPEDPAERLRAARLLLAEEARIGMLVGVAVGWALKDELEQQQGYAASHPDQSPTQSE